MMASHFVPNITMGQLSAPTIYTQDIDGVAAGPPILSCVHKGVPGIFMDCHMMVAEPEKVHTSALV
jgi:pentose-5-phosphate-3-epimerase